MKSLPVVAEEKEMMGEFEKYEVESALRDIQRAEEHKKDAKLMEQVRKMAGEQLKTIKSIADLRSAAKEISDE